PAAEAAGTGLSRAAAGPDFRVGPRRRQPNLDDIGLAIAPMDADLEVCGAGHWLTRPFRAAAARPDRRTARSLRRRCVESMPWRAGRRGRWRRLRFARSFRRVTPTTRRIAR